METGQVESSSSFDISAGAMRRAADTTPDDQGDCVAGGEIVGTNQREWHWPGIGLLVVLTMLVVPSFPGRINNDTISMMSQMRDGEINDWHSPMLQLIWRPLFSVGVGVGFVFIVQTAALYVGVFTLTKRLVVRKLLAVVLSVIVCLLPPTYAVMSTVTRDAWFISFWLLTFAALCWPVRPRLRLMLVVGGATACYWARQNGLVVAPVACYFLFETWPWGSRRRLGWLAKLGVAVVMTGAIFLVTVALTTIGGVDRSAASSVTPLFDLARLSIREQTLLIPPEANPDGLTVDEIGALSDAYSSGALYTGERGIKIFLSAAERDAVMGAWSGYIVDNPIEYWRMRWQLFSRQIGWSGDTILAYTPQPIDNPFNITAQFPALSERATSYLQTFNSAPEWYRSGFMYRGWPWYLLLATATALTFGRRSHREPILVGLAVTVTLYLATALFLAPELTSRMVAPATIVSMVGCTILVGWFRGSAPGVSDEVPRGNEHGVSAAAGGIVRPHEPVIGDVRASDERRDLAPLL